MTVSKGLDKNAESPSPQKYRLGILLCAENGILEISDIAKVLNIGPNYTKNLISTYQGLLSKDGELKTNGICALETLSKEYGEQARFYLSRINALFENGETNKAALATKEPHNSTGRDMFTPSNRPHLEDKPREELIKKPSEQDISQSQNLMHNQAIEEIKPAKADTKISDIIGVNNGLPANELSDEPEYDGDALLVLKFLMGIESGLKKEELDTLFAGDGGLYLVESRIRKNNLFSKIMEAYALEGPGRKKLDSLKQECSTIVPEYNNIIDYLRVNKTMPPQKKNAPIITPAENTSTPKDEKPREISKSEHEELKCEKEKTPYASKETVVEVPVEKNPEMIAEILESRKPIDVEDSSAGITYGIKQGYVRINDGMTGFNLLKINNSYNPHPSEYGMRVKLSPELVLLELVMRTKSTKKDLERYANTYNQKEWKNSTCVLERKGLVKELDGALTLTEDAMNLLLDAEFYLAIFLNGEGANCRYLFDDEAPIEHHSRHIDGVGNVLLHSPSLTVLSKIKEYCAMPKIEEKEESFERKAFVKPEPAIIYQESIKIKPVADVKKSILQISKKNGNGSLEGTGIYDAGSRRIVHLSNGGQRTLFAKGHFQNIGKKYLGALKFETSSGIVDEIYLELKDLDWITGDNGNKIKTDKGLAAERILEQLMNSSNVVV